MVGLHAPAGYGAAIVVHGKHRKSKMELVVSALLTSISIDNLLYIVAGVALGNIIGAIQA